jgi:hypothetical protein
LTNLMTCYRIWCLNSRRALRPPRPRQRRRLRPHALPTLSSFSGGSDLPRHRSSSSGRSPGLFSAQMPTLLPHMCGHESSAVPDSTGRGPPHLVLDAMENCVSAVSREMSGAAEVVVIDSIIGDVSAIPNALFGFDVRPVNDVCKSVPRACTAVPCAVPVRVQSRLVCRSPTNTLSSAPSDRTASTCSPPSQRNKPTVSSPPARPMIRHSPPAASQRRRTSTGSSITL